MTFEASTRLPTSPASEVTLVVVEPTSVIITDPEIDVVSKLGFSIAIPLVLVSCDMD